MTGALFVFSGIVKLNDPSGFGIKLNEYFDVFAQDLATPQDSMRLVVYSGVQKLIDQKPCYTVLIGRKKWCWRPAE